MKNIAYLYWWACGVLLCLFPLVLLLIDLWWSYNFPGMDEPDSFLPTVAAAQYLIAGLSVLIGWAPHLRTVPRPEQHQARIFLFHLLPSVACLSVVLYPWPLVYSMFRTWYSGNLYERFAFTRPPELHWWDIFTAPVGIF